MEIMTTEVDKVWTTTMHLSSSSIGKGLEAERTPETSRPFLYLVTRSKSIIGFPELQVLIWKTEITFLGLLFSSGCATIKWSNVINNIIERAVSTIH